MREAQHADGHVTFRRVGRRIIPIRSGGASTRRAKRARQKRVEINLKRIETGITATFTATAVAAGVAATFREQGNLLGRYARSLRKASKAPGLARGAAKLGRFLKKSSSPLGLALGLGAGFVTYAANRVRED